MATPPRLEPLLEQFDWACRRLVNRMSGPEVASVDRYRAQLHAALAALNQI